MSIRYQVWVEVEKDLDNEYDDLDWEPRGSEVALAVQSVLIGRDLDLGWNVVGVRA